MAVSRFGNVCGFEDHKAYWNFGYQMPRPNYFANLWTLSHYPNASVRGEWNFHEKLLAVKDAGFDGFCWFAAPEVADIGSELGLSYIGFCAVDSRNYASQIVNLAPMKPVRVNVHMGDSRMPPDEAARVWIELAKTASDLGLEVDLELHRGTCTETPEKAWQIADIIQQRTGKLIQFSFDPSHFAVVRHVEPPYARHLLEREDLIQNSKQMHLRPFNGHHCQVPMTDGRGHVSEYVKPWLEFVDALFDCWIAGCAHHQALWLCPEIGALTSGYWIPTFPDPWSDAIVTLNQLNTIWEQVIKRRRCNREIADQSRRTLKECSQ